MESAKFSDQFSQLWEGGYYEGNPQDPMSESTFGVYGYNSCLYTVFLACIRPYVSKGSIVLEIGPGRGGWSKAILSCSPSKLTVVDAAPAEHTKFWDYVGRDPRVEYQVTDGFDLNGVLDSSVDFVFSFGVFCHLMPEMCECYLRAVQRVLKSHGHAMILIADYDKYNRCIDNADNTSIWRIFSGRRRKGWIPTKWSYRLTCLLFREKLDIERVQKDRASLIDSAGHGGWFHWGIESAVKAAEHCGLTVVEQDVGALARDPIIHLIKM